MSREISNHWLKFLTASWSCRMETDWKTWKGLDEAAKEEPGC